MKLWHCHGTLVGNYVMEAKRSTITQHYDDGNDSTA